MFKIPINNHPHFDNITRTVEMIKLTFDGLNERITLDLNIFHYIDDINITDMDKTIQLLIDNSEMYPDGQGGEIGNYDYFILAGEAGTSLQDMVTQGVLVVQANGKINPKCNYKSKLPIVEEIIE